MTLSVRLAGPILVRTVRRVLQYVGRASSPRQCLFFSFAGRYFCLCANLTATALLARLLTPSQFGVFGVAAAIVALLSSFGELGVGTYLIQERSLSEEKIRTAFTATAGFSVLAATGLVLLAKPVAAFYGEPGMAKAIEVLALNFIVLPVPVIITALMRRKMAFAAVAICDSATAFVSATATVVLALVGYGFMSPVWGSVTGNVTAAIVALLWCPQWRVFRPSLREWNGVLGYGGYSSANVLINVFYNSAPQLILGRLLGFSAVGLFTRAVITSALFDKLLLDAVQPVILPVLAAKARSGSDFKATYLRSLEYLSAVQWPSMLFLAAMADPIVLLLFGPDWRAAVPLVRLLAIAGLALFAASLTLPSLASLGRIRDATLLSAITVSPSLAIIYCSSLLRVEAVAASFLVIAPFQAGIAIRFVGRRVGMTLADLASALWKGGLIAVLSSVGPFIVAESHFLASLTSPAQLASAAATALCGWMLGALVTRHPVQHEIRRTAAYIFTQRSNGPVIESKHRQRDAGPVAS